MACPGKEAGVGAAAEAAAARLRQRAGIDAHAVRCLWTVLAPVAIRVPGDLALPVPVVACTVATSIVSYSFSPTHWRGRRRELTQMLHDDVELELVDDLCFL